jgi:sortase (surface protein transpeptidase)
VLTGHVWDALNRPGVFEKLADLRYGDQVIVHNAGKAYIYEVRERLQVLSDQVN